MLSDRDDGVACKAFLWPRISARELGHRDTVCKDSRSEIHRIEVEERGLETFFWLLSNNASLGGGARKLLDCGFNMSKGL